MQLSQKQKTFFNFFYAFWKSRFNFEYFQRKDEPDSWRIFDFTNPEKRG